MSGFEIKAKGTEKNDYPILGKAIIHQIATLILAKKKIISDTRERLKEKFIHNKSE